MNRTAEVTHGGRYRWELVRTWGEGEDHVVWIGCNPSVANATIDDTTIRKEIGFTQRLEFPGFRKFNLAPHVATDPRDLWPLLIEDGQDGFNWSERNRARVIEAARGAQLVIAAWGAIVAGTPLEDEAHELVRALPVEVMCLGRTAGGFPRHPARLAYDTPLERFA